MCVPLLHKGACAQKLHADTTQGGGGGVDDGGGGGDEGHRVLFTCFVALQDVTEDMGPTWVAPRTHCGEACRAKIFSSNPWLEWRLSGFNS